MTGLVDANDLHTSEGLDVVKVQIEAGIAAAMNDAAVSPSPALSPASSPAPYLDEAPPLMDLPEAVPDFGLSPAPSADVAPPAMTLEDALKRFALISGTTKIWDSYDKQRMASRGFALKVGKQVASAWSDSGIKRLVHEEDVRMQLAEAQASNEGRGGVAEALERFVYLSVSNTVWDHQRREVSRLDDIKHEIPEVYDFWYRNPKRKSIDKNNLVFNPTQTVDPETHINMFRGLPLQPVFEPDKCQHIRQMFWQLCNCDKAVWNWLAMWLAYPLQHVGAKMATAVLMHSEVHGSGKSLLFDGVMRPIYGEYGATLGQHQMESQYTDWQSNLLYGLFEEIFSREKKYSQTGTVKQMITATTTRIEKKFVSGWEEANHMNCIFLSNELQPFPVEPSDRRFLVVWPNWKLEPALQKAVAAELDNGGTAAFFGWLLQQDLGAFDPHTKPPMTEAKQRLIDFGRPSWDVFYEAWVNGDTDAPYHACLSDDLYRVYKRWCRDGSESLISRQRFSEALAARITKRSRIEYDSPGGFGRPAKRNVNGTFFLVHDKPKDKSQKEWLSDCVASFRREIGAHEDDSE